MSNPSSTSHLSYPSLDFNTDPNIDYSDPFGLGVSGGMNTGCNLIVNYLPHDFEDHDLQVCLQSIILPFFFFFLYLS